MKRYVFALVFMTASVVTPSLAADVGVSISVGQPGFYGHIEIGDYPQPRLIFAEPVIIHRVGVMPGPAYFHVPPGHAKDWAKHCARYDACGRPVYFVEDSWYNDVYVPQYQERHGKGSGKNAGKGHGKGPKNK
jgi:hypothetical protein